MKKFVMPSMDIIVKEVNDILARYPPDKETGEVVKLTLRQIYYQLVAKHIIENDEHVYKSLSRMLVKARETGLVDDSRMEDRGRETIGGDHEASDPKTFYQEYENWFRGCWKSYSRPMWLDQPRYVEVFVEKDALSRLVSDTASKYGVSTSVCKGYSSYTLLKNAADRIVGKCEEGDKEPVVLHFGDLDPSGVDMTRDIGARLEKYGVPDGENIVHRIALTPEQVKIYNLPPAPVKGGDSRTKKFVAEYGDGVVELDALDASVLQELVRSSILKCINSTIWNQNAKESKEEQMRIKKQVDAHFAGEES